MKLETFLSYSNWKWFWITFIGILVAVLWYVFDSPLKMQSGSTFYGYTIGIICGLIMVYLLWYGVRKRAYFSNLSTLKEVLSAHVWIGLSLLILVPLHSGFRFHWNMHTFAFVLCALTIITGIWGVYLYRSLPLQIKSNRGEGSMKNLLEHYSNVSIALKKIELQKSDNFLQMVAALDTYLIPSLPRLLLGKKTVPVSKEQSALLLKTIPEDERQEALNAISLIDRKYEFLLRIEKEALVQFWLKAWLVTHVPLACGAMILLILHIFSVLYYGT